MGETRCNDPGVRRLIHSLGTPSVNTTHPPRPAVLTKSRGSLFVVMSATAAMTTVAPEATLSLGRPARPSSSAASANAAATMPNAINRKVSQATATADRSGC